jgi:hypothetical protein
MCGTFISTYFCICALRTVPNRNTGSISYCHCSLLECLGALGQDGDDLGQVSSLFFTEILITSTWQPQEVELAADLGVGPTGVRNIIAERVTPSTLWFLKFSLSRNHEADPNYINRKTKTLTSLCVLSGSIGIFRPLVSKFKNSRDGYQSV